MTMRKLIPALALCVASTAAGLTAGAADTVTFKACPGKPSADDEKAARGLFEAGKTAYNEADYNRAIQYWRDAFDRDCTAAPLLLNIANAYEKAGNIDAAITALETYLKRRPDAEDAPTIQKRIENMKRAQKAAPPPPPTASAAKSSDAVVAPPPTATPTQAPTAPPPSSAAPSSGPGIAPWIVVGGGGALALVGTIVFLGGKSKVSDAESSCPAHSCTDATAAQKGNDGRSQEKLGGILAGVGVAGVAGGLAWYFLAQPKDGGSAYVVPSVSPGFGGISAGGKF
jgi:tetratricopeptide (TPR) repeat protein